MAIASGCHLLAEWLSSGQDCYVYAAAGEGENPVPVVEK